MTDIGIGSSDLLGFISLSDFMNWIRTSEQLPPEAESVLVTDGGCYAVAYSTGNDWVDTNSERPLTWWTDDGYSYWEPTHWMPLPHGPSSA